MVFMPVCGCDGKTYGNECEAVSAGVVVAMSGECSDPPPGDGCDVASNTGCGKGQFCKSLDGLCYGKGDCAPAMLMCPDIFQPTCGCDGKTYGNTCDANSAGVNVLAPGECVTGPGLQWFDGCGTPVCKGWFDKGVPPCDSSQTAGAACKLAGQV